MWKQTVFFPLPPPPPLNPPTPPKHPRTDGLWCLPATCWVRKIPSAVSFQNEGSTMLFIHLFIFLKEIYNSLTVHVEERALVCIGARSLQDGAKLEHVSTPRSECYRACLKFTAKVFQAWGESWQFQTSRLSILIRPRRYGGLSKSYLEGLGRRGGGGGGGGGAGR